MMFLSFFPKEFWIAILLSTLIAVGGTTAYLYIRHNGVIEGRAEIQSKWDAERLAIAAEATKMQADQKVKQDRLAVEAELLRKTKDEQITAIGDQLTTALERLRQRPSRSSAGSVPTNTGASSAPSCTGAELYREDGQFLAREAARAQRLLANLSECQAAHSNAAKAVN